MEFNVQLEKASNILRKLTITVPAKTIANRFERQLIEVQRKAKIKGFREGHVPLQLVRKFYGDDVRHRLLHTLMDESFDHAVKEHQLKTIGQPRIDSSCDTHAQLSENQDFTFTATVEIFPEIELKTYKGLALKRNPVEVTNEDVEKTIKQLLEAHAELVPSGDDVKAQKGSFVDITFDGGLITEQGLDKQPGMQGTRLVEIGTNSLIDGFEDNLIGMKKGETKTFKLQFPKDYFDASFASKDCEFTATVNEVKEKKLPELTDEYTKEMGYESIADIQEKARSSILRHRTEEEDQRLRNELLEQLVEKNKFDVPTTLVQAQTRELGQEFARNLKQQGFTDPMIQDAIQRELENLKTKAEGQVSAGLLLDAVAKKEEVTVTEDEITAEIEKMCSSMKNEASKIRDFYRKPQNKENLAFRLKEEKVMKFLLDNAKIK